MPESDEAAPIHVGTVSSDDPEVAGILEALTVELAGAGYMASETFGYSVEQLQEHAVHLVGARVGGKLVGVGGSSCRTKRRASSSASSCRCSDPDQCAPTDRCS